ncbi:MAG: Amuc_1100 family pilus-like protein [Victivallaceae bacterium]|nr:Amuc_1100 family pilus-like protein [Victivallaceae bacterium]
MKRFLKKHIGFVIAIGVSVVIVLALLVMVLMQNGKRLDAANRLNAQKDAIKRLNDSKPSPAQENLETIESDTVKYRQKLDELHRYFGRPYERALERFSESLGIATVDFRAMFRAFWEAGIAKNQRPDQIYALFVESGGLTGDEQPETVTAEDGTETAIPVKAKWDKDRWENAMKAFVEEAQKYTLEDINGSDSVSAKELLMSSLGVPRSFGDNEARCKVYVDNVRSKLIKKFTEGNVGLGDNAQSFSFVSSGDGKPSKEMMVDIGKVWDIICDLAGRIAASKVASLEDFSVDTITGVDGDGGFRYYRFQVEVSGTLDNIRQLTRDFADAYKDSRVYIVRRMSLMKDFDSAQILVDENINRATSSTDARNQQPGGRNNFGGGAGAMDMGMLMGMGGGGGGVRNTVASGRASSLSARRGNIEDGALVDPTYYEGRKLVDELMAVSEDEEKTAPGLRRNYARPALGVGRRCTASIVVDYVVYVTDELVTE